MTLVKRGGGIFAKSRRLGAWVGGTVSGSVHLGAVLVVSQLHARPLPPLATLLDEDTAADEMIAVGTVSEIGPLAPPLPLPPAAPSRPRSRPAHKVAIHKALAPAIAARVDSPDSDDFDAWDAQGGADVLEPLDSAFDSPHGFDDLTDDNGGSATSRRLSPETPLSEPLHVSAGTARSLRAYDDFPSLPEPAKSAGLSQRVDLEICVSDQGSVSAITMDRHAALPLQEALRSAIRTWRYRPLLIGGTPTPFCHALEIQYRAS
jgi:hypothetical protein